MVKGGLIFTGSLILIVIVTAPLFHCLDEQIKKFAFNTNGYGTYSFEYETTAGTFRREDGGIVGDALFVRGEYGYIDPGGKLYAVKYVADQSGYRTFNSDLDNDVRFNDRRII